LKCRCKLPTKKLTPLKDQASIEYRCLSCTKIFKYVPVNDYSKPFCPKCKSVDLVENLPKVFIFKGEVIDKSLSKKYRFIRKANSHISRVKDLIEVYNSLTDMALLEGDIKAKLQESFNEVISNSVKMMEENYDKILTERYGKF
jgi:DNA-directed RNA polymerase subunit RPC12/RpoP